MTRRHDGPPTIADLFAYLALAPELPGAACKGNGPLFDAETVADKVRAESLCLNACPSLGRCRRWVASLPASRRPVGVVAGTFREGPPVKRRRRPHMSNPTSYIEVLAAFPPPPGESVDEPFPVYVLRNLPVEALSDLARDLVDKAGDDIADVFAAWSVAYP